MSLYLRRMVAKDGIYTERSCTPVILFSTKFSGRGRERERETERGGGGVRVRDVKPAASRLKNVGLISIALTAAAARG